MLTGGSRSQRSPLGRSRCMLVFDRENGTRFARRSAAEAAGQCGPGDRSDNRAATDHQGERAIPRAGDEAADRRGEDTSDTGCWAATAMPSPAPMEHGPAGFAGTRSRPCDGRSEFPALLCSRVKWTSGTSRMPPAGSNELVVPPVELPRAGGSQWIRDQRAGRARPGYPGGSRLGI